jgi:hypothetical protein
MADENPYTAEMRQARALLMTMTEEQRGLVLCWFCSSCRRYVGPGDRCTCAYDEEARGEERAAIVRWVRSPDHEASSGDDRVAWHDPLQWAADEIEAGAHRRNG